MSSLATSGVPDLYLSGKKDCWVEWKHDEVTKGLIRPKLSALQKQWINSRYDEGRLIFVVVTTDSKTGILYKNKEWNDHSNGRRPLTEIIAEILQAVNA